MHRSRALQDQSKLCLAAMHTKYEQICQGVTRCINATLCSTAKKTRPQEISSMADDAEARTRLSQMPVTSLRLLDLPCSAGGGSQVVRSCTPRRWPQLFHKVSAPSPTGRGPRSLGKWIKSVIPAHMHQRPYQARKISISLILQIRRSKQLDNVDLHITLHRLPAAQEVCWN